MNLSAEDRVALLLGRAIHRAEAATVLVEQLQARVVELEKQLADRDESENGYVNVTSPM